MHHLCIIYASSIHNSYIILALLMHHPYIIHTSIFFTVLLFSQAFEKTFFPLAQKVFHFLNLNPIPFKPKETKIREDNFYEMQTISLLLSLCLRNLVCQPNFIQAIIKLTLLNMFFDSSVIHIVFQYPIRSRNSLALSMLGFNT